MGIGADIDDGTGGSETWACFSVFDHVKPGAFLSEAVMYDRLVVPVPPRGEPGEWQRWEDQQSVTSAVTEIKEACDELERAVRKRKIWVTSRRLFSFAQIVLRAALTPLSPLAIGLVVAGLGQFTATEMLSDPEMPESRAPDLAMLLDLRHELDLGT
jgi:hypothetical protein